MRDFLPNGKLLVPVASMLLAANLGLVAHADTAPKKSNKLQAFAGTVLNIAAMNYTGPHQELARTLVTLFNGNDVTEQQADVDANDPYGVYAYDTMSNDYDDGSAGSDNLYDGSYDTVGYYPAGTPSFDAALIGIGNDGALEILDNGATLYGPGAGRPGDRVGVAFAPANDAYMYVVSFDGTGWVQALFPDPVLGHRNPVRAGEEILLPGDDLYGLDNVAGVETIYVFASNDPRPDIESMMQPYFGKERPASSSTVYRSVERPIIISRGLTGLRPASINETAAASTASGDSGAPVLNSFLAADDANELVVTLWFHHK